MGQTDTESINSSVPTSVTSDWIENLYSDRRLEEWSLYKQENDYIDGSYDTSTAPETEIVDEYTVDLLFDSISEITAWSAIDESMQFVLSLNTTTPHDRWLCYKNLTPGDHIADLYATTFTMPLGGCIELKCNGKLIGLR